MFFDEVEMSKDADDFWKTMSLEDVEEFKRFLSSIKDSYDMKFSARTSAPFQSRKSRQS